jgi:hypothetical protein
MELDKRRRPWLGYLAAALGCLSVLVAASLIGATLREQDLRPPNMYVHLGNLHVVAFTAHPVSWPSTSACAITVQRCGAARRAPVYAIWLVDGKHAPANPQRAFTHLLSVPLSLTQLLESLST